MVAEDPVVLRHRQRHQYVLFFFSLLLLADFRTRMQLKISSFSSSVVMISAVASRLVHGGRREAGA